MKTETGQALVRSRWGSAGGRSALNRMLLFALASLSVYPLLVWLRGFDDNTLTSWNWAVAGRDTGMIFSLHAVAVAAAYALSQFALPRRTLVPVLLFLPLCLSLFLWCVPEVVIDASRYFTQAKHLKVYGFRYFLEQWGTGIDAWTDLPLPALLYGSAFVLLGESRAAAQFLNTILFAATVGVTFMIGRLLWGREAGFLAGLLLLGVPYLLTQVPLMLSDVTAMFFFTLSVYLALSYIGRGGGRRLICAALGFAGAFLSKYSLWPALFLMMAVIPAARLPSGRWREILSRAVLLSLTAAAVPAALLLWKGDVVTTQMSLLTGYQWSGLSRWSESPLSTFTFQVHPFIVLLAGYGAFLAARRRDASYLVAGFLPALAVLLQIGRTRYLMVLFPLLAAASAYGLCAIADQRFRRFVAYSMLLFSAVTALFLYRPFLQRMSLGNLMDAAQVLNSTGQERVKVYVSTDRRSAVNPAVAVPLLDLYTRGDISFGYPGPPKDLEGEAVLSPFRFTWRYRNPSYYEEQGQGDEVETAVVFIAGSPEEDLPSPLRVRVRGYRKTAFVTDEGLFRYRTLVSVFLPPAGSSPAAQRSGAASVAAAGKKSQVLHLGPQRLP